MAERAQAVTVEGILAAVLLTAGLLFAVQVSAVTQSTEQPSSHHLETQHRAVGETVLSVATEDGTLQSTLLFWNPDRGPSGAFEGASTDDGAYTGGVPASADHENVSQPEHADVLEFGRLVAGSLADRGLAYNLYVRYPDGETVASQPVVRQGQPGANAVTATRTVTLYDHDRLYTDADDRDATLERVEFYADDEATTSVYTVLDVELVIWEP